MKTNINGDYYETTLIELWDFNWDTFITEDYEPNQKFIIIFADDDELIIEYDDFMDNQHIKRVGVKKYLPISFGV